MKTYHIYYSYKELPHTWDALVKHDVFLQCAYLKALEKASPSNIQFFYVGVFHEHDLIGIAIIQRVQLYLKDMFRHSEVLCFKEFLKATVSKVIKGNMLVVGNLTQTGQHGIFFRTESIEPKAFLNLVQAALETLKTHIKSTQNKTIRAIMFKDYCETDAIHKEFVFFNSLKLHQVSVQPNMVMPIASHWVSNDDYINDFHKKYRDRYKRARKKLGSLRLMELDLRAVQMHSKRLHTLYLNVSHNAKFNTFFLPESHFYSLKLELKDQYRVYGYFLNDVLVGFYSLIINGKHLETYFLGYETKHQHPNQLYLNMLYDMAKFAIENGFENVVYARTAMEIKSSIGAIPKAMVVYLKHTNSVINGILKQLILLMDPTPQWEQRHPFKR